MKDAVLVSVWMKIAMYWLFVFLLVKLLSDSDKQLLVLQTNWTLTDEDSICYHHKSSIYHIFKIYSDIAVILKDSTVNKLKSIYEPLISKLLKNWI